MSTDTSITRLSQWLFWACTGLAYAVPAIVALAIARGWFDPARLVQQFAQLPPDTTVTAFQGALVAGVAVLSTYPLIAAFWFMRRLFARYRQGEILTDGCAVDILRIGQALFAVAATTVIVPTLQLLILSWNAGAGARILSIGVDGSTLGFLLSGGLLAVIGRVMHQAARTADENRGFV
jgi:hypothetical protein